MTTSREHIIQLPSSRLSSRSRSSSSSSSSSSRQGGSNSDEESANSDSSRPPNSSPSPPPPYQALTRSPSRMESQYIVSHNCRKNYIFLYNLESCHVAMICESDPGGVRPTESSHRHFVTSGSRHQRSIIFIIFSLGQYSKGAKQTRFRTVTNCSWCNTRDEGGSTLIPPSWQRCEFTSSSTRTPGSFKQVSTTSTQVRRHIL